MKLIQNNVNLLSDNQAVRQAVVDAFTPIQEHSATGGMTLDVSGTPVVVCHGKMSLPDERSLRARMRTNALFGNAKLSRTNNVQKRVDQYAVADNPQTFKSIQSEKAAEKSAKDTEKAKQATAVK